MVLSIHFFVGMNGFPVDYGQVSFFSRNMVRLARLTPVCLRFSGALSIQKQHASQGGPLESRRAPPLWTSSLR